MSDPFVREWVDAETLQRLVARHRAVTGVKWMPVMPATTSVPAYHQQGRPTQRLHRPPKNLQVWVITYHNSATDSLHTNRVESPKMP